MQMTRLIPSHYRDHLRSSKFQCVSFYTHSLCHCYSSLLMQAVHSGHADAPFRFQISSSSCYNVFCRFLNAGFKVNVNLPSHKVILIRCIVHIVHISAGTGISGKVLRNLPRMLSVEILTYWLNALATMISIIVAISNHQSSSCGLATPGRSTKADMAPSNGARPSVP